MPENRTFQLALVLSVLAHAIFFLGVPDIPLFPSRRSLESLKITYYTIKEEPKKEVPAEKKPEPIIEKLPEIKKEEILKPPEVAGKKAQKPAIEARPVVVPKKVRKEFEAVVREEQDESKKALYIGYYRAVRERIKERVDRNYPTNKNLGKGEVFLSFVVASSGELLQVAVLDRESTANPGLRRIAIDSIRDASPFPAFPKGMSQYQITFNVIISFELSR